MRKEAITVQFEAMNTYEEVYAEYYDTAGNYHWTGTMTGTHFVPLDGAIHLQTGSNLSLDKYAVSENSQGIPQY